MKRNRLIEITAITSAIVLLAWLLRTFLFYSHSLPLHDSYFWEFPIFHYFTEGLLHSGALPLWNPYSHGGEPFYPLILQMKLLDPIPLLVILIGHFISNDTATLFNLYRFTQAIVMSLGCYVFMRRFTSRIEVRLLLIPIIFLSSLVFGGFRQHGQYMYFTWLPWIAYFAYKILIDFDFRWRIFLAFSVLLGISSQSYFFLGPILFLLIFLFFYTIFYRDHFIKVFTTKANRSKILASLFTVLILVLPNIALLNHQNDFVYPARMLSKNFPAPHGEPQQFEGSPDDVVSLFDMPYSFIEKTGSSANIWNLIQILNPNGNAAIYFSKPWGKPSEDYIYFGILPLLLILVGVFLGRAVHKKIWLGLWIGTALFSLGPNGGLHRILFYLLPFFQSARNTSQFIWLFQFTSLYFFVAGIEYIFTHTRLHIKSGLYFVTLLLICSDLLIHLPNKLLSGYPHPKYMIGITTDIQPMKFPEKRIVSLEVPASGIQGMRYLSLLHRKATVFSEPYFNYHHLKTFDELRNWPKWNSYILSQTYFKTIHSNTLSQKLADDFSIEKSLLQFDSGIISIKVTDFNANTLALSSNSKRDSQLIWSDGYDKDWIAEIDKIRVPLETVNGNFKSLQVPKDSHQLVFKFRPMSILISFYLFLFVILLSILGAFYLLLERYLCEPDHSF